MAKNTYATFEASPYYGEKDGDGNEPILGWGVWCVPEAEWVVEDGLDQASAKNVAEAFNIWVAGTPLLAASRAGMTI